MVKRKKRKKEKGKRKKKGGVRSGLAQPIRQPCRKKKSPLGSPCAPHPPSMSSSLCSRIPNPLQTPAPPQLSCLLTSASGLRLSLCLFPPSLFQMRARLHGFLTGKRARLHGPDADGRAATSPSSGSGGECGGAGELRLPLPLPLTGVPCVLALSALCF
jgi:hypothetical protein